MLNLSQINYHTDTILIVLQILNSVIIGAIFNPKDDKEYKLTIKDEGDKLNLRGYIGWGVLSVGKQQTWIRVKN